MPEESSNVPAPQPETPSVLDKPVPNPVAKNPNFFTHKVVAAVGIILVGAIVVLFGLALIYHVNLADLFSTPNSSEDNTVATSSAKPTPTATSSATKDETAGWKTYTNSVHKFSFKYPETWKLESEGNPGVMLKKGTSELTFMWDDPGIVQNVEKTEIVSTTQQKVQFEFYTLDSGRKLVASDYTIADPYTLYKGNATTGVVQFNTIILESDPQTFNLDWNEVKLIVSTFKFL